MKHWTIMMTPWEHGYRAEYVTKDERGLRYVPFSKVVWC